MQNRLFVVGFFLFAKMVLGAKTIDLYPKVVPATESYNLDNVEMKIQGIFQHV